MFKVVADSEGGLQPGHEPGEIALRSFNGQVHMVGHQAVCMYIHSVTFPALIKRFQEQAIVFGSTKNARTLITTHHHMVDRPRKFNPYFPCHSPNLFQSKNPVKTFVNC